VWNGLKVGKNGWRNRERERASSSASWIRCTAVIAAASLVSI